MTQAPCKETALYLFTRDLRLDDNPALAAVQAFERLHCLFVVEPRWFRPGHYEFAPMHVRRWCFLQEALVELVRALTDLNQQLDIRYDEQVQAVVSALDESRAGTLILSRPNGNYERRQLQRIQELRPHIEVQLVDNYTLYGLAADTNQNTQPGQAIPSGWLTSELPAQYTPFRKQAEQIEPPPPTSAPDKLPASAMSLKPLLRLPDWLPNYPVCSTQFEGGENSARAQLKNYFDSKAPLLYKASRNDLDGWDSSSKLSPWLSQGSLSPRRVWQQLHAYEAERGSNESTQWLRLELLWREYFQWLALKIGARLFAFQGLASHKPLTSHYSRRLQAWCQSETEYPLVNALMCELRETGYLSNRGRQIVASCLVNELQVDWRYGAACFEHWLLDYDMASNWGNWQYIAGVGVDPRGGRHFNLDKQQQLFDPDGTYQARWLGDNPRPPVPRHSVDAADWPIQ